MADKIEPNIQSLLLEVGKEIDRRLVYGDSSKYLESIYRELLILAGKDILKYGD